MSDKNKNKINQPYYTEPVLNKQSNLSDNMNDSPATGLYQNSEVFPPRGSFINVPAELLFGPNAKLLDIVFDHKEDKIGSDLYENLKNEKLWNS